MRTCVGCRARAPRAQLLRLVIDDDGGLAVDARALEPGRGAWIHPDPACLELAERRRAFGRALRSSGPLDAAPVRAWLSLPGAPDRMIAGPAAGPVRPK